ncbi:MAG: calcium-binding protein [Planctomycetaceae bacterium]
MYPHPNRRSRNQQSTCSAEVELLEDRQLLTATLANGVLTITGTENADRIRVKLDGANLTVKEGSTVNTFTAAQVTSIVANGLGGDDRIILSKDIQIPATIDGGTGNDFIVGGARNDTLTGGIGIDRIDGRDGADTINGGDDDDWLNGQDGDDIINGGLGNDRIRGGEGDDTLKGDAGDDRIRGDRGDDDIDGGADNDLIDGGLGDDDIHGDGGNDKINTGGGEDEAFGDEGDDLIRGDGEEDNLDGGTGDDWIQDRSEPLDEDSTTAEVTARATEIFSYLDGNSNGSVVESEVTERQWNRLEDADTSGDDAVSQTEFTAYLQDWLDDGKSYFRFLTEGWHRRWRFWR